MAHVRSLSRKQDGAGGTRSVTWDRTAGSGPRRSGGRPTPTGSRPRSRPTKPGASGSIPGWGRRPSPSGPTAGSGGWRTCSRGPGSGTSLLKTCVLPAFGTTPLARVEQPAVAAWVAELRARGLSASRIRQAYRVLSSLMAAAVQGGYIAKTPCAGIRLPRAARRDATLLTASQVDRLAEAAGEYGTLIYLLAYGGLRWGEVAALRRRRCDLLRRRVEVAEAVSDVNGRLQYGPTKTFERRWVRLPVFLVERLARQLEGVGPDPDELVFRGQRGAPLRYQSFRRAVWDQAVVEAGLPDGAHAALPPAHLCQPPCGRRCRPGCRPATPRAPGRDDHDERVCRAVPEPALDEIATALDGLYQAAQSAADAERLAQAAKRERSRRSSRPGRCARSLPRRAGLPRPQPGRSPPTTGSRSSSPSLMAEYTQPWRSLAKVRSAARSGISTRFIVCPPRPHHDNRRRCPPPPPARTGGRPGGARPAVGRRRPMSGHDS